MNIITNYRDELIQELDQILNWWQTYTTDNVNGGFHAKVDNYNQVQEGEKGLVLNARILYTFSSAYLLKQDAGLLTIAERAYQYLIDHFYDKTNGGFYWSVASDGVILDGKKQVYGQAFVIYGLSEFFKASHNSSALELARETYQLIDKYSFDAVHLGYIEAHSETWGVLNDVRLSEKDQNDKKSMNTHLHVVEAYANLYSVWQDESLKKAIESLLDNFKQQILDLETFHLRLFFSEIWEPKSSMISFGHDIEASWLLLEAAEFVGYEVGFYKDLAIEVAEVTRKNVAKHGGLLYEYDNVSQHWVNEYHWWPQAEAMVGFFNAWQLTNNHIYLEQSLKTWEFVKNYIKDREFGEWFWGVDGNLNPMKNQDKAGFWKCPYHNGRACIEIIKRIARQE